MKNKILEAVFVLSGIALVLYFLFEIKQILVYLIISIIVTIIGQPIVNTLNKISIKGHKMPHSISAVIAVLIFIMFISLLAISLIPLINEQANSLSLLSIEKIEANLIHGMSHLNDWLVNFGFSKIQLDAGRIKDTVDMQVLVENRLARKNELVKILGRGKLKAKLNITVHKFTATAKEAIEKAGGSATEL